MVNKSGMELETLWALRWGCLAQQLMVDWPVDGCCSWEVFRQELTLLPMILCPDQWGETTIAICLGPIKNIKRRDANGSNLREYPLASPGDNRNVENETPQD